MQGQKTRPLPVLRQKDLRSGEDRLAGSCAKIWVLLKKRGQGERTIIKGLNGQEPKRKTDKAMKKIMAKTLLSPRKDRGGELKAVGVSKAPVVKTCE